MDEDQAAYKKSVRNMSFVLAAIVITVFAALIIPPYINPVRDNFQSSASEATGQGFTLYLQTNSTSMSPQGRLNVTLWVVSTSPSINNVTASGSWSVLVQKLWTRLCTTGWPIGVGVMQGHYDASNYTLGHFVTPISPLVFCPVSDRAPGWFAFEPHTSVALISINGTISQWVIRTSIVFSSASTSDYLARGSLPPGVYTVVGADEWGDILTVNLRVSG